MPVLQWHSGGRVDKGIKYQVSKVKVMMCVSSKHVTANFVFALTTKRYCAFQTNSFLLFDANCAVFFNSNTNSISLSA